MVLKQGEGYKPRGKTSAIVGTSEVQLQLPLEAGKQEQAPMSMGTVLHGGLPGGCPHSPQSAKELAVSCKNSSGKHLQVPSQWKHSPFKWLFTSLVSQQQPTCICESCLKPDVWESHSSIALPGACCLTGLHPEEMAFQQVHELPNSRQVWADGDVLCFIPTQKKYFYY